MDWMARVNPSPSPPSAPEESRSGSPIGRTAVVTSLLFQSQSVRNPTATALLLSQLLKMYSLNFRSCLLLLAVNFYCGFPSAFALDCNNSSVQLWSQSDIDNFNDVYGGGGVCVDFYGNISIAGDDIVNLAGLSGIESIHGHFSIRNALSLTSLAGLESLKFISGDFSLQRNLQLISLSGLDNLVTVNGAVGLYTLPLITNLQGLGKLEAIGNDNSFGWLQVGENNSLQSFDGLSGLEVVNGSIDVFDNPILENVTALNTVHTVLDGIAFSYNENLQNLDGFLGLEAVGSFLWIHGNGQLDSLDGFSNVAEIGQNLIITGNNSLFDISGLNQITVVNGDLEISSNPQLANLAGLASISSVSGDVVIALLDSLIDLDDLSNLTYIGGKLEIGIHANLTNISGLSGVNFGELDALSISGNQSLINLDGLERITGITGDFYIQNNSVLQNVDALSNIDHVAGRFNITGNTVLGDLDGLSNLLSVSLDVIIKQNPLLSDCDSLIPLLDYVDHPPAGPGPGNGSPPIPDVGWGASISSNAPGCMNLGEIRASLGLLEVDVVFSDQNPAEVPIELNCEDPNVGIQAISSVASVAKSALFQIDIQTASGPVVCDAIENSTPVGYSVDQSDCVNVGVEGGLASSCEIANFQQPVQILVQKTYLDSRKVSDPEVQITLQCDSGEIAPGSTLSTTNKNVVFEISNFAWSGSICSATEVVPQHYLLVDDSECNDLNIFPGVSPDPGCMIFNTQDPEVLFFDGFE
jgi:hypothetical protein